MQPLQMKRKVIELEVADAIAIYDAIRTSTSCLLQSKGEHDTLSRFSYIGIAPLKQYTLHGRTMTEHDEATGATYTYEGEPFQLLRDILPKVKKEKETPMFGGLFGYIGYEVGHAPAYPKRDPIEAPDGWMVQYEVVVALDRVKQRVELYQTIPYGTTPRVELEELAQRIQQAERRPLTGKVGTFTSDRESFEKAVRDVQVEMKRRSIDQVVLSRRAEAEMTGDPLALYAELTANNPSPYQFYFDFGTHQFFGSSPESVVKVHEGKAIMNPIAGTRRRGETEEEDAALERELLADPKELMEHRMLIDQAVEALGTKCDPAHITVTKREEIVRYEHVMHIVSEVEGILRRGDEPIDALALSFPAGTVTGEPKEEAMQLIDQYETERRGFFGGAAGYMSYASELDFALAIRSMMVHDGKAYIQAGAGIVEASIPSREAEETAEKMRSLAALSTDGRELERFVEQMERGIHLTAEEMTTAAHRLFDEETPLDAIESFLRALYEKGEVAEEMASLARVMRSYAVTIPSDRTYFDNCGTGGDGANTFNISTTSAFVLASLGVPMMKHGNRKVSSASGSSDVLEALDVPFGLSIEDHVDMANETNVTFLHAPHVHPKLARIGIVRQRIEHPTIFNLVGPFTNPARLDGQLIGGGRPHLLMEYAKAMQLLGLTGLVVTNEAGLDEAGPFDQNRIVFVSESAIVPHTFRAADVGLQEATLEAIRGGDATENAAQTERILRGERGAPRDTVVLNVGLALVARGMVATIEEGIERAEEAIDSGKAYATLERARSFSKEGVE